MRMEDALIERHVPFTESYRLLRLAAPGIAPDVQPGQFVHIRLPAPEDALLRRPFSVFKADVRCVEILYKAVGRGTRAMLDLVPGQTLSLIGPLGRGFPPVADGKLPILIAGGYGMAALYLAAARAPRTGIAFFGGRGAADILCVSDFEALGWRVEATTEDGSLGRRGLVTAALDDWLEHRGGGDEPEFFACGPNGMLREVGLRAERNGFRAWISLDRNMGCGVGACLTCVCRVRDGQGGSTWARCCREGPVFDSRDVIWEEET